MVTYLLYWIDNLSQISQHCQPVPLPVDKLSIEKTGEAPVWCLHTLSWPSSAVQSICDAEKMYGRHC